MWQRFESMLEQKHFDPALPEMYRDVCHHLALARSRHYTSKLCSRLNHLVMLGHTRLYANTKTWDASLSTVILEDLPNTLRNNARLVWLSMALFFITMLITGYACYIDEEFILSIFGPEDIAQFESMYDPESEYRTADMRDAGDDWYMFGFYIANNIGIGFRTFASGIFAGIGSLFILFYNGLAIGAVAGHLTKTGYTETFYPFVVGHGSFELTAIALSCAAGLRLGFSLINPNGYSRIDAMKLAGKDAIVLVYAVIIMLLIAAFLEAFWSSSSAIPNAVKYSVGGVFWVMVIYYLIACTLPKKYSALKQSQNVQAKNDRENSSESQE